MVLAKKSRGRGRRDDTPARTPTPGRRQSPQVSPEETTRQNTIRQALRDRSRRPVTMPNISSSSASGQTTPDEQPGQNVPPVERNPTPELPSPDLNELVIGDNEVLSVRLQELTTRVIRSETQMQETSRQLEGMQANIRENTGFIATMITTVPALQATVIDL